MNKNITAKSFAELGLSDSQKASDAFFMDLAFKAAQEAFDRQETPVGAVLVDFKNRYVFISGNCVEQLHDASAHAELNVLREVAQKYHSRYLLDCTLYVTLEPCAMCAAAIGHFRIPRLVYGAYDPKGGAVAHGARLFEQDYTLHSPQECIGGVNESQSTELLKKFFRELRKD